MRTRDVDLRTDLRKIYTASYIAEAACGRRAEIRRQPESPFHAEPAQLQSWNEETARD
jgi:hypothetical protein